ncbi:hypothetical protein [Acetobacter sp.]|uniref:hypothetical protein n=1 Tax=Acetobacter sp. TaxID=440 RepID=UPI0039EA9DEE
MTDTVMLTVFLRHDQSKNLAQLQGCLDERDWWNRFPPRGVEVVTWNVVMGIGQIVTLRLPPALIPAVNVELEHSAWGVFSTEFFPSYDFMPVHARLTREAAQRKAEAATPGRDTTAPAASTAPGQTPSQATPGGNGP